MKKWKKPEIYNLDLHETNMSGVEIIDNCVCRAQGEIVAICFKCYCCHTVYHHQTYKQMEEHLANCNQCS